MFRHIHSDEGRFSAWLERRGLIIPIYVLVGAVLAAMFLGVVLFTRWSRMARGQSDAAGQPEMQGRAKVLAVTYGEASEGAPISLRIIRIQVDNRESMFQTPDFKLKPGDSITVDYRIGKSGRLHVDRQLVDGRWVDVPLSGEL